MPTTAADGYRTAPDHETTGWPPGVPYIVGNEACERFSYYGMRAILVLYMVAPLTDGGMGLPVSAAGAIQGTYSASVYLMTMMGGWFADKLLGLRRSVFWGGVLIMSGHLSLAIPGVATFYGGLLLVVLGTGLLKGNISAMVGQLYDRDDTRRDAGYSVYYMGVNLGGFLGPLFCGWFAQQPAFKAILAGWGLSPESAWHFGFGAAAVGMFLGLVQYSMAKGRFSPDAERPLGVKDESERRGAWRQFALAMAVAVGAAGLAAGLDRAGVISVTPLAFAGFVDVVLVIVTVGVFVWFFSAGQWTADERTRLMVIVVLFLGATVFWAGFEQAASTLNLFADRSTANTVFGIPYPASWLQSVNSAFIILLAPAVGLVWLRLGRRNPSSPAKFAFGLFFLAVGYALMIVAALAAGETGRVSPLWLVGCFFFQTIGELCLSPVGMSAMSTLAPARLQGLMMGVWFLATSIGNKVAGRVGGLYESLPLPSLFTVNTLFVLVFAVVLALLVGPIRRLMARPAQA